MGRQRDPKRDQAFEIYKASGGEIHLNVIAAKLEVSESTVRSWKNRGGWGKPKAEEEVKKKNATPLQKEKRNATDATQRNKEKDNKKTVIKVERHLEPEEDELTDKQRFFCMYYVKCFNATQAALKAEYSPESARQIGYENMTKPYIRNEIIRLKSLMTGDIFVEAMDILNVYIKIAFTDITDYLTFGQKEVPVMTMFGPMMEGEEGDKKPVTKIVNYVDFKPSNEIDGTLISEVKQGADGVSIKLADKMKALEKLEKYFDLLPDNFKRKVDEEKLKMDRERLELDKARASGEGDLDEELIDDWVGAVMDDGSEDIGDQGTQ